MNGGASRGPESPPRTPGPALIPTLEILTCGVFQVSYFSSLFALVKFQLWKKKYHFVEFTCEFSLGKHYI